MKHVAIAAVALLVGFLIGGLAPRAEVRDLELQLATAEAGNCDQGQVGRDLALLLGQGGDARPAPPSSPLLEICVDNLSISTSGLSLIVVVYPTSRFCVFCTRGYCIRHPP